MVLANWAVQQAAKDDQRRLALKWNLTRRLYEIGLGKTDILELFRLVDWLLRLPRELEAVFERQLYEFETQKAMPYVTSIERHGIEKGIEKGIEQGQLINCRESILDLLITRFGAVPPSVREGVTSEANLARLRAWLCLAGTCTRLEDFKIS